MVRTLLGRQGSSFRRCWATALPEWTDGGAPTRCLDGSTPVHAGAFSGRRPVVLHLLRAGGDLRLRDQQGRTPRDWAEQGGARQSREVLELLELCRVRVAALVHGGALAASASLGQLQAGSVHHLCGSLWLPRLLRADGYPGLTPVLPFLSSLWPLGLLTGIPLADPKELLPAQGEPDRTYESSSCTLMANLLWRGHPVTARQLKVPGTQPDVLLADLQHCRYLHPHPQLGPPCETVPPLRTRVAGLPARGAAPTGTESGRAPHCARPAARPPAAAGAGGPAVPAGPLACSWRP
uniref:Uncharacterized protein n=1 Tax=Lynx canadensis TaxID=61383 RepID=A0A667ILJ2_LYNCA